MLEPIKITPKAQQEIQYIIAHKNIPSDYGLRVLVEGGGGCGGASFRLGFDQLKETDLHYFCNDIAVFYDKRQLIYLIGLEIDFEERNDERGFVFNKK